MPKQKLVKIINFVAIGLLVVGALFVSAHISWAQQPDGGGGTGASGGILADITANLGIALAGLLSKFFGLIAEVVVMIIMPIVMRVLDALIVDPNWVFSDSSPLSNVIQASHSVAIDLTNGFLLFGLVVASAAIILRVGAGTYNIKKFLGSFVMMAVLANLSSPIFDAANELGIALFNSVSLFFSGRMATSTTDITDYLHDLASMQIDPGGNVAGTILVLVAILISAWVLIRVALLLIERTITLFILLVIAPLSFGLSVLPTTQKMASQWFENIIKWMLAMPITYAILALGVYVLKQMSQGGSSVSPSEFIYDLGATININNPLTALSPIHIAAGTPDDAVKNLFVFIIGMTLIYMSATVPKMLKVGGAVTGLLEAPGKMVGVGSKLGKTVADFATGKGPAGKAQTFVRATTGGLLNIATGSDKFGKLKNLGTQIGSIPATYKKAMEAMSKNRETELGQTASRNVSRLAGAGIFGWNPWKPGLVKGVRGEVHEETGKRRGSYPGYDGLSKNLLKSSDNYINYATNARVTEEAIRNTRLTPTERGRNFRLLRAMQHRLYELDPKLAEKDNRSPNQKLADAAQYADFIADDAEKDNIGWLNKNAKELAKFESMRKLDPSMNAYYLDSRDVEPPAKKVDGKYVLTQRAYDDEEYGGGLDQPSAGGAEAASQTDRSPAGELAPMSQKPTPFTRLKEDQPEPPARAIVASRIAWANSFPASKLDPAKPGVKEVEQDELTNVRAAAAAHDKLSGIVNPTGAPDSDELGSKMATAIEQLDNLAKNKNNPQATTSADNALQQAGITDGGQREAIIAMGQGMDPNVSGALRQLQLSARTEATALTTLIGKLNGIASNLDAVERDTQNKVAANSSGDSQYAKGINATIDARVTAAGGDRSTVEQTVTVGLAAQAENIHNDVYTSVYRQESARSSGAGGAGPSTLDEASADKVHEFLNNLHIATGTPEEYKRKDAGAVLSEMDVARRVLKQRADNLRSGTQ